MREAASLAEEYHGTAFDADLPTKWRRLNRLLSGGLFFGHLSVLGARPGMGKTSLAIDLGLQVARDGFPVANFSLEASERQWVIQCFTNLGQGVPDSEQARELFESLPYYVDDTPGISPGHIARELDREEFSEGLVVIDYLQLMSADEGSWSRNDEVSQVTRGMLDLAKRYRSAVLALSQLNREPDKRHSIEREVDAARPVLSDLRDSGAIEQDATEVMFLFRPDYYREYKLHDGQTELLVQKNRYGEPGTVKLVFYPEEVRFESASGG